MNVDNANKIIESSVDLAEDLELLGNYPPFSFSAEKQDDLFLFIRKQLVAPRFAANKYINSDGDKQYEAAVNTLKEIVDKGDDVLPTSMRRDVDEARLYMKRYEDPYKALEAAKESYDFTDDDVLI